MNAYKDKKNNEVEEKIARGFRSVVASSGLNIKQYLLGKVGVASHEIRVDVRSDFPLRIVPSEDTHKQSLFYMPQLVSAPFCVLNTSGTSPSVSRIGMIAKIDEEFPLDFKDPRSEGKKMLWEYDFIEMPKNNKVDTLKIPSLEPGLYIGFSESVFLTRVWWPQVYNKHGYQDWVGEEGVPMDTGQKMNDHINQLASNIEVWLYVVLDSEELLPFLWSSKEERFVPGFLAGGIVVK
ncbi:hypothetical protein [Halomonas aestuarii]|uniref:hypothetical protein n=1 Tax=Halomonas aestuarii TaxID=1897729 RepID=UPI000F791AA0|nr:hypothetical protein [Halomonas aestuarii]